MIPEAITDISKRYDFLYLFDVQDGNPNGNPDAGNMPRVDPETMHGLVTDVCLKRKIRNYVDLAKEGSGKYENEIFVRDSGIALNTKIKDAVTTDYPDVKSDKKKEIPGGRDSVCKRYFDVRMFGGVLSTGDYNCGQVRGPVQLTFSRSVDPIYLDDVAITRVAITREGEQKENEMGRKFTVPYGLYIGKGFYSPMLAKSTGVTEHDLKLFWRAMVSMFEQDRSAARGYMEMRAIYIFRHENALGDAPSGRLFSRLKVRKQSDETIPRRFEDYVVEVEDTAMPEGVTLTSLVS